MLYEIMLCNSLVFWNIPNWRSSLCWVNCWPVTGGIYREVWGLSIDSWMLYNSLVSGDIPYVGADLAGAVSMQGAVSMRGKNCQCGEFLFRLCGIMLYNFLLSGGIPYVGADLAGAVSMQGLSVWSQGLQHAGLSVWEARIVSMEILVPLVWNYVI